jgi:MtN3 and saliva related transmembrane protein
MNWITVLGFGAALCSTVSFVPQAVRILKTRDTGALSAPMYALTTLGFALWLGYGVAKQEWPLIVTNGICFILAAFILTMTLASARQKDAIADAIETDPAAER